MRHVSASLVAGLLATLLIAGVAAADPRVQVTRNRDLSYDGLAFGVTAACGFTVELHSSGKAVDIERYDADGNLVAYIGQAVWHGYLLNPATGKTVRSKLAGPVQIRYLEDGTIIETSTGAIYHRNVPGAGLVSAFVGRIQTVLAPTGDVDEEGFPVYEVVDEVFSGQWTGNGGVCQYLE